MANSEKPGKLTWDDVVNLLRRSSELLRLKDTIREIIDSEPIDIPRLEISLREAISAVDKARTANAADVLTGRRKKALDGMLAGYDGYLKMLLAEIVGVQH